MAKIKSAFPHLSGSNTHDGVVQRAVALEDMTPVKDATAAKFCTTIPV